MTPLAVDRELRETASGRPQVAAASGGPGGIVEACEAYRRGAFGVAFGVLAGTESIEAAILRARMHLACERVDEAIGALESANGRVREAPLDVAGTYWTLALAARRSRGDEPHALREALTNAAGYALSAASVSVRAEWYYYEARHAFARGDVKNARAHATHAFLDGSVDRGRVYALLAEIDAFEGNAASRRANVIDGLTFVRERDRRGERDAFLAANLLAHLARMLCDRPAPALLSFFEEAVDAIVWTVDLDPQRYHVDRALASAAALRGDLVEAFARLRAAAELAPTPALRAEAHLDRARLATDAGEPHFARDALAVARAQASRIASPSADADDRALLAALAEGCALVGDEPAARMYLDAYERADDERPSSGMVAREERAARERLAYGLADALGGRTQAAIAALEEAYRLWYASGNALAAGRTARRLAALTADARRIERAREAAAG